MSRVVVMITVALGRRVRVRVPMGALVVFADESVAGPGRINVYLVCSLALLLLVSVVGFIAARPASNCDCQFSPRIWPVIWPSAGAMSSWSVALSVGLPGRLIWVRVWPFSSNLPVKG